MDKNLVLANCDTDSILVTKPNGEEWTKEEIDAFYVELNSLFPDQIKWDPDGEFASGIILKAKNYVLFDGKKKKTKGSALRSSSREPALKEFIDAFVDSLLKHEPSFKQIDLYNKYAKECVKLKDINRWVSKKTFTQTIITSERANETKVLEALKGTGYSIGDKFKVYHTKEERVKLVENWNNDHDEEVLLKKLFNTLKIFGPVIDIKIYNNYSLKKNKDKLLELVK